MGTEGSVQEKPWLLGVPAWGSFCVLTGVILEGPAPMSSRAHELPLAELLQGASYVMGME